MTRVADTSVLYALVDGDDDHHGAAREALADPDPVLVPTEILVETHWTVGRRLGSDAARAALEDLLATPHVAVADPVHFEAVWRVFDEADGALSLADAFVVQTCRALGAEPLAFDADIVEAAG